jgi:peptide/nickel transport system permease protein
MTAFWRTLSPSARVGGAMLATFILLGVLGPWIAPYSVGVGAIDLDHIFASPDAAHPFGRDKNGLDTLSQLLWGARSALTISVLVVSICAVIGVTLGTIAGYFRGVVDDILMRVVDILMSFPGILMNIAVVATVAHPGLPVLIAALAINGWVGYARVARGQVLSLRERDYVQAARALGASNARIMFRHLVPNLLAPTIVQITFGFGTIILVEASLSFLGLGAQVDYTWGAMLDQGTTFFWKPGFRHYALISGGAIAWVILGANLLGDGLRDRLDPKSRKVPA